MSKKIHKEIDLSGLPYFTRRKDGKEKRCIDWSNSVGFVVPFVYGDVKDNFIISKYSKEERAIYISNDKYKSNFKMPVKHIKSCPIGVFLEKYTSDFKVEIGDVFKDDKRDLVIIYLQYLYLDRRLDWRKSPFRWKAKRMLLLLWKNLSLRNKYSIRCESLGYGFRSFRRRR